MRYASLLLLVSAAAPAQTWNWRQPDLPKYFRQFKLPNGSPLPAAPPKTVLAPGQKCAIPLVNVLKRENFKDPMVFRAPQAQKPLIATVTPPAPSCDDVR